MGRWPCLMFWKKLFSRTYVSRIYLWVPWKRNYFCFHSPKLRYRNIGCERWIWSSRYNGGHLMYNCYTWMKAKLIVTHRFSPYSFSWWSHTIFRKISDWRIQNGISFQTFCCSIPVTLLKEILFNDFWSFHKLSNSTTVPRFSRFERRIGWWARNRSKCRIISKE